MKDVDYDSRTNIFIASQGRCGSTHIKQTLCRLLDYRPAFTQVDIHGTPLDDEPVVNYAVMQTLGHMGGHVFHTHARGTYNNAELLKAFKARVVVVTRNIFDSLVSLKEMLEGDTSFPGQVKPYWNGWRDEEKWKWMTYYVAPWILSWHVSWQKADIPKLWVGYDSFFENQVQGIVDILKFSNIEAPGDEAIKAACDHRSGRFHVGAKGRGRDVPEAAHTLVNSMAAAWKDHYPQIKKDLL